MTVRAEVIVPDEPVTPGSTVTAHLHVWNESRIVDAYDLRLVGPPAQWPDAEAALGQLPVYPGNHEKINVPVTLPRDSDLEPGALTFAVRVASVEDPAAVVVPEAAVIVGEFRDVEVEPSRARVGGALWGTNLIVLHNTGNAAATVRLRVAAESPEAPLRIRTRRTRLTLQAGEKARISVTLRVRSPVFFGAATHWKIGVNATWDAEGTRTADFVHRQRPFLPKPALKVLIALTAAAVAAVALWFSPLGGKEPEVETESAKGPSQVESVRQAEKSAEAKAKEKEDRQKKDDEQAGALRKKQVQESLFVTSEGRRLDDAYRVAKGYRLVLKSVQITASGPAEGNLLLSAGPRPLATLNLDKADEYALKSPVKLTAGEKLTLRLECGTDQGRSGASPSPSAPSAPAACKGTAVIAGELVPLKGPFAEPDTASKDS